MICINKTIPCITIHLDPASFPGPCQVHIWPPNGTLPSCRSADAVDHNAIYSETECFE